MNKGLSLQQIADTTKISIRFLKAIEDEEFHKLPGGIFNISYLKQYAMATGFDEGKLMSLYDRRTESEHNDQIVMTHSVPRLLRWFKVSPASR